MIALFDSGVGGLSILQEVQRQLPQESTVYLADAAHFPYGQKDETQVQAIAVQAVNILMRYQPKAVVVACNTASTSALPVLREHLKDIPVVGVVPAIKPAAAVSKTRVAALLATVRTLQSDAYRQLKQDHGEQLTVIDQPCPGWVELVEAGHLDDAQAEQAVRDVIVPLTKRGADTFVLGCTHYPFLRPLIQRYAGPSAEILDSGRAVAEQLQRVVATLPAAPSSRREIFLTTGPEDNVSKLMAILLGRHVEVSLVS